MMRLFKSFVAAMILLSGNQTAIAQSEKQRTAKRYYIESEAALRLQNYRSANRLADRASATLGATNPLLLTVKMRIAYNRGNYITAEKLARQYLALGPNTSLRRKFRNITDDIMKMGAAERRGAADFPVSFGVKFPSLRNPKLAANKDLSFSVIGTSYSNNGGGSFFSFIRMDRQNKLVTNVGMGRETKDFALVDTSSVGSLYRKKYKQKLEVHKTGPNGKRLWRTKLKGSERASNPLLAGTSDGGFVVLLKPKRNKRSTKSFTIHKINGAGRVKWSRSFPYPAGIRSASYPSIYATEHGDIMFRSEIRSPSKKFIWTMALGGNGTIVWQKISNRSAGRIGRRLLLKSQEAKQFILRYERVKALGVHSGKYGPAVFQLDNEGNQTKVKQFQLRFSKMENRPVAFKNIPSGGFLALLKQSYFEKGTRADDRKRAVLVRLDRALNIVSRRTISQGNFDPVDMAINAAGEIAVIGRTRKKQGSKTVTYLYQYKFTMKP